MSAHQQSRRAALAGVAAAAFALPAFAQQRPAAPAPLSAQDKALVDQAVAYLQTLNRASGRFQQIDERGRVTVGDFYLQRPGKVRFAWDSPTDLLMVSDGNRLSLQNKRLKTFDQYPLMSTPLSIFLAKDIRLDRGIIVTRVQRLADGGFSLTARDGRRQAEGQIVMVFGSNPIILREWTTTDAVGTKTRIVLSRLTRPGSIDPALFVLKDPRPKPATARPD